MPKDDPKMLALLEHRVNERPVIGVQHRMGTSVYFGPFENKDALRAWEIENDQPLLMIVLVDPESPRDEWWYW